MSDSTSVIPFHPDEVAVHQLTPEQQEIKDAIIEGFSRAQIVGFGGDGGSVVGAEILVRSHRLWIDPNWPVTFPAEEIETARMSLVKNGQGKTFRVIRVPNPQAEKDWEGKTECDLLIVDIDDMLVFTAGAEQSDREYRVRVDPYQANYHTYIQKALTAKSQQHRIRYIEIGRSYQYAVALYEAESAFTVKVGRRKPKDFPKQQKWAEGIGISQELLSSCVMLANQPQVIINLVESEAITLDQLMTIGRIEPESSRIEKAQQLADKNLKRGKPVPRADVRADVGNSQVQGTTANPPGYQWSRVTGSVPVHELIMPAPQLPEIDAVMALAMQFRNIDVILTHVRSDKPTKALKKIHQLLLDEDIQAVVGDLERQLRPTEEDDTDVNEEIVVE